ncbi:hypothetical protein RRG08_062331 [Elysia crispata]|uniref:Uncharacterized protein n=1 Tax=Elysia crispata TaxID=231223 RepID=A0AAE0YGQ8_9GAST|nr:hypothetical protein RRG08_062331 [Elysia crispata]
MGENEVSTHGDFCGFNVSVTISVNVNFQTFQYLYKILNYQHKSPAWQPRFVLHYQYHSVLSFFYVCVPKDEEKVMTVDNCIDKTLLTTEPEDDLDISIFHSEPPDQPGDREITLEERRQSINQSRSTSGDAIFKEQLLPLGATSLSCGCSEYSGDLVPDRARILRPLVFWRSAPLRVSLL